MNLARLVLDMLLAQLPGMLMCFQRRRAQFKWRRFVVHSAAAMSICRRTTLSKGDRLLMRPELSDKRPPTVGVQLLVLASTAAVVGDAAIASKALLFQRMHSRAVHQPAAEASA